MLSAVTDDDFWALIAVLDGVPGEDAVQELTDRVALLPRPEVAAFAEHLAAALAALDTGPHRRQVVRDVSEPHGGPALPTSEETFLFVRCAVVAAGRQAWARVVAEPPRLAGAWHLVDGELLLTVVPEVQARVFDAPPPPAAPGPRRARHSRWLVGSAGFDRGVPESPRYGAQVRELVEAIETDPAWRAWWSAAGLDELELVPFHTGHEPPARTLRRARRRIEATLTLDGDRLATDDPQAIASLATDDVLTLLDLTRAELGLPDLPPLPAGTAAATPERASHPIG